MFEPKKLLRGAYHVQGTILVPWHRFGREEVVVGNLGRDDQMVSLQSLFSLLLFVWQDL